MQITPMYQVLFCIFLLIIMEVPLHPTNMRLVVFMSAGAHIL